MKKRIGDALVKRAAASDDPRLRRQALLINSASISTLHSLGSAIIRRHFNVLGIDPNFRLLDNDEAKLLRADLADGLLETRFDDPEANDFRRLIDLYGGGQATAIRDIVLNLHAKLQSLIDPNVWLASRRSRLVEAIERPLRESQLGKDVLSLLRERIVSLGSASSRLSKSIAAVPAVKPYVAHVDGITQMLRDWYRLLTDRPYDTIAPLIREFTFDRLPTVKASEEKDRAQTQINALKKQITAFADNGLFSMTEERLREGLGQTLWVVNQVTSLVQDFDAAYRDAKQRSGTLDFNDLERFTLQLLQEPGSHPPAPSWIAKAYQQQFRHVLVDEYQDINELQDTLLALLSRPDNLFAVGDIKQSIYRFRQADPTRFKNRAHRYRNEKPSPGEVIDLQQNFRSRGPLLEVLNGVFEALMTEESAEVLYDETHRLIPGATFATAGELFAGRPIELHVVEKAEAGHTSDFESDEREAIIAAQSIRRLLGYDNQPAAKVTLRDGSTRAAEPRDIVILLRALRVKAERFAAVLRRAGIAVQADSTTGFFEATEIRDMLSVLKLIANGRDDIALAAYLRSPLVGWEKPEDKLAEIRVAFPSGEGTPCYHQAFARYAAEKTDELSARLRQVQQTLTRWRDLAERRPVADVLWTILQETSYLSIISGLPDGEQRVANVLHLHARARQFEHFNRPTVGRFLHFLQNLEEQSDSGMPAVAGAMVNAVRIMSVHKSKGLEFPIVILPDLGKSHNLRDADTKLVLDDSVGLAARVVDADKEVHYPSLATVLANHHIRKKALAEELRVLYVAGTRAKEHLILIGTDAAGTAKQWDAAWSS
ncbi:MAG TPA: UvrD-helicase domain-containing protein, partial [Tepidisphaeraceae bacterium]